MTEAEWDGSDDAGAMLDFLWQRQGVSPDEIDLRFGGNVQASDARDDLTRSLYRFYLASCRRIWPLLPQKASRRGVELAEQFLAGEATAEQVSEYNWHTEGAAFRIDYAAAPGDAEAIAQWVAEVRALPAGELRAMLFPPEMADEVEPREQGRGQAGDQDSPQVRCETTEHTKDLLCGLPTRGAAGFVFTTTTGYPRFPQACAEAAHHERGGLGNLR